MKLNDKDGQHDDTDRVFDTREALAEYLNTLSTYGRFLRFAKDFRKKEGYTLAVRGDSLLTVKIIFSWPARMHASL